MAVQRNDAGLRSLGTLFDAGTVAGLTDGELLERFVSRQGDSSELAFATLVGRHGPMVYRTCRAVLRDEHEAHDAFQATFLILARRGRSLRVHGSAAPWLHRVAVRAATRTRRSTERWRARERKAAERVLPSSAGPDGDLTAGAVQEEVNRLSARHRIPLVLCDLEGRTYEEAARELGCPVGTIKSRLARGRERLRARLSRRGLAPGVVFLGASIPDLDRVALPTSMADATIQGALDFSIDATAKNIPVSATAARVAEEILRSMMISRLRAAFAVVSLLVTIGGLTAGGVVFAQQWSAEKPAQAPAAPVEAKASPAAAPAEQRAWQRADVYIPPNFEKFFPDDPTAGPVLDALVQNYADDPRSDAEKLRIVRQGLRRARSYPSTILSAVGNTYIWGKSPQNPDAIEIMYHASDSRGPGLNPNGTVQHAVHNGLSVVEPKSPAILRALTELCMRKDDANYMSRVAWGAASQRSELIACLKPYLESKDDATREKAADVNRIFNGELNAFQWAADRAKKHAQANFSQRLPEIKQTLLHGSSMERSDVIFLIQRERLTLIMDESFVGAFAACAVDPDEKIRRNLPSIVGEQWIWYAERQSPEAISLMLRLSNDADSTVQMNAVYFGLSTVRDKRDDVIRALLACAISDRRNLQRVAWGMEGDRDAAKRILDDFLRADDPDRARGAREIYREITKQEPPTEAASRPLPQGEYIKAFRDLYEHLAKIYPNLVMKGIDWAKVGRELEPKANAVRTERDFGLLVEELVARLEDSHAVVLPGSAAPPVPDLPQWGPGLVCLIDDRDRPVVFAVEPGSSAKLAGITPGSAVVSVNGTPAEQALRQWMKLQRTFSGYSSERTLLHDAARAFLLQPNRDTKLKLVLEDPDRQRKIVDVIADRRLRYFPKLPVSRKGIVDSKDVSWTKLEGGIGYLYIRRIRAGLEGSLDQALNDLGEIKGLILDLRGNTGGGFDTNTAFVNFDLASEPRAGAKRPRYKGPIALLIDERCISAGEGWASWFIANKRARVFGTTSAGASSRKETYTLTNGLYKVVVPVKAYTGFLDRPIERRGLEPDVEVRCSARDITRGRDTVVEAAAAWLARSESK